MTAMTTLAEIRSHDPCPSGFAKIRNHFGVSAAEAKSHREPFPIALLLETNNFEDTLWVVAHVNRPALLRFLIRRLDTGQHSALKILRALRGDFSAQIAAVETVVSLLRRTVAGEKVSDALYAAGAADAADAVRATADSACTVAYAAVYAAEAADTAAIAAEVAYAVDAVRAAEAAYAADDIHLTAAKDDLRAALQEEQQP